MIPKNSNPNQFEFFDSDQLELFAKSINREENAIVIDTISWDKSQQWVTPILQSVRNSLNKHLEK